MDHHVRGSSPIKQAPAADSPEQLLDAFKAAALSVTKLYKTSAAAQSKARADGYQDCLDDLLAFLDRRNLGVSDGEGWQIRKWATERLEGRDGNSHGTESEDESERPEPISSPEIQRAQSTTHLPPPAIPTDSAPSTSQAPPNHHEPVIVPSQDNFTFQSAHPYPSESYLNIANLDLSDSSKSADNNNSTSLAAGLTIPSLSHGDARGRRDRRPPRARNGGNTASNNLGRGAGTKRTINLAELFDVGSIASFGKDPFGRDGKRTRHT
ncbi:uncharacterized protein B0I36DRAFT_152368 [Microdochium trichocladiopsis]|uniref:Uncharacterized protein n=1 Tax=Microdochium trichocladiopsis TaxID=1682393 RepID=A0A9P8Y1S8_9PEZI|nr:uncharacterized protein B0I36DRAFT_152368 [Microdochium trichocladiopsis]KAH7025994.1 hypothetical protein B0I36DRAFT_152368 [Microdochium trichocladiopsis]